MRNAFVSSDNAFCYIQEAIANEIDKLRELLESEEDQKTDVKWLLKAFCKLQDWLEKGEKQSRQKELDGIVGRFKEALSKNKSCLNSAQASLSAFELRERMTTFQSRVESLASNVTKVEKFEMTEDTFRQVWLLTFFLLIFNTNVLRVRNVY